MPEKFTYLLVDLMCIICPLAFSFHPKVNFYKQWRGFFASYFATSLFFTRAGIWSFNPRYTMGIDLLGLPIEEYLFFLCVPYACVFTYYLITIFFNLSRYAKAAKYITWALILFLTMTALLRLRQLYTSVTFLLLASFLLYVLFNRRSLLPSFYLAFAFILIPFLVSNGILTGTGLAEPVVRYNNYYNSGIRILTIPFEDVFYGMLLILINVTGFDYLTNRYKT